MRNNTIIVSERSLMFCVGGQLFDQAPNRQPRKAEIIMQKVKDAFRKDAVNNNEYYSMVINPDDFYNYLDKLLKSIPEFEELNLTQIEYDNNIKVDDERPPFKFITRYDVETPESWKNDFIDLDAFVTNVVNRYYDINDKDEDCFCCVFGEDKKYCDTCIVNPNFKNNYECTREPKGKYTFSCAFDCRYHKMICCEECDKKDTCDDVCDSSSKECGRAMIYVNGEPGITPKEIIDAQNAKKKSLATPKRIDDAKNTVKEGK